MPELKGRVSTSNVPCTKVTWNITNFAQTSRKINSKIQSPPFSFADASWNLELVPNGSTGYPNVIMIRLKRLESLISEHSVIARIGFKTVRGEEYESIESLVDKHYPLLVQRYTKRSLVAAGDFLLPKETVTVFCHLRLKTQPREALLQLPVSPGRSLDSSHCNQDVAGSSGATHSASSHPNSQGSNLSSEMQQFEGQVSTSNVPCIEVTWEIPNFVQTSRKIGYKVQSRAFSFAEASWCLALVPNGFKSFQDCMFIYLWKSNSSVSDHSVIARLCFKTDQGEEYRSVCTEGSVDENCKSFILRYEKRSHVEACNFLLPKGTATVFCQLRLKAQPTEDLLQLSPTHELHPNSSGIHHLQSEYKKLLDSEEDSDVCLKVSDKEFRAHKNILRARSSVFSAMFKHDTQEKNSGEVVIEDLDSESFPDFLQHVYAGSVDTLTEKNVFSLYTAADKYNMPDLKSQCKNYMEKTLSVDTFCDVMITALRYKEDELLKFAIDFFSKNLTRIIVTVKWQKFLKEYDTAANELFIKALVPPNEEPSNP